MSAVDWAKQAYEIAATLNNADLLVALANLKSEYADKVTEIASLKDRIRELEQAIAVQLDLEWDDPVWRNKAGVPYCPRCKAKDQVCPMSQRGSQLFCASCNLIVPTGPGRRVRPRYAETS